MYLSGVREGIAGRLESFWGVKRIEKHNNNILLLVRDQYLLELLFCKMAK